MSTAEQTPASSSSPVADPELPASVEHNPSAQVEIEGKHSPSVTLRLQGLVEQGNDLLKQALEDVAKPSVASFLETCDSNPKLAAVIAAPALLGIALVLLFFVISVIVLSVWTFSTILVGVLVVVVGGLLSLLLKLVLVTAATLPLAAMATGFFVATVTLFKYITSPAATLVWRISSSTKVSESSSTIETQEPAPRQTTPMQNTEPSQQQATATHNNHTTDYSNLIAAAKIAWDSTVILASFLKWTSKQLWFVGSRAVTEIRKNMDQARQDQAQAQSAVSSMSSVTVEGGISDIPPASNNSDGPALMQRPSHARVRDDTDEN